MTAVDYRNFRTFALVFISQSEKNEKSWRFRKKTMGLKCLIYRRASKTGCKYE